MKEIVFVTSNKRKVASAKRELKEIVVLGYEAELIEPRSDNITEIAIKKVVQAYELVNKPCIALDAGFFVKEFPKAYVNHMLETIGLKGLLKLMEGEENRYCEFRECIAYYDGNNIEIFECRAPGKLALEIQKNESDKKWSDLWKVFIPDGFDKTLVEFDESDFKRYDNIKSTTSMRQFGRWFLNMEKEEELQDREFINN